MRLAERPDAGCVDEFECLDPVRFDLLGQPQRPGELAERAAVRLSRDAWERAVGQAGAVPLGLWLVIAIEAQRSLAVAADAREISTTSLVPDLDEAAAAQPDAAIIGLALRRLRDYAGQLRTLAKRPPPCLPYTPVVALDPSLAVAAAWELAAQDAGMRVSEWASGLAEQRSPSRVLWEAAAAEQGLTLAAWVALQAARR